MRAEISFRNTSVSEKDQQALRERVEKKSRKVTRFLREPVTLALVIHGQRVGFRGELHISGGGGDSLKASLEADDPIAVVDGLLHTVERAARRRHDRRHDPHRDEVASIDGFQPGFDLHEHEDRDLETEEIQKAVLGRLGG